MRSVALGLMAGQMLGVLKGRSPISVVAAGLCAALVPLGVDLLRAEPRPGLHAVVGWSVVATVGLYAMYLFGQAG